MGVSFLRKLYKGVQMLTPWNIRFGKIAELATQYKVMMEQVLRYKDEVYKNLSRAIPESKYIDGNDRIDFDYLHNSYTIQLDLKKEESADCKSSNFHIEAKLYSKITTFLPDNSEVYSIKDNCYSYSGVIFEIDAKGNTYITGEPNATVIPIYQDRELIINLITMHLVMKK
jgi:hypothetical protein